MASPSYRLLILPIILGICSAASINGISSKKTTGAPLVNMTKLAVANNDLALRMYHRLAAESSENVFFSPFSLSTVFGMLYYGTNGNTAKELRKVLGYDAARMSDELVHQAFHDYLTQYMSSNDSSSYDLKFANAILFDKHFNIVPTYKKVQYIYKAIVREANFVSDNSQVLQEINDWVSEKTSGKIDKLVNVLDPFSLLVLLNAVYFKGTWKYQFQSNLTEPGAFFGSALQCESKKIPMMKMTQNLYYNDEFDIQAVELPYKENISMFVLLPKERDGLVSLEKKLTLGKFSSITRDMVMAEVNLTLPKFKLEYSRQMVSDFKFLGANEVFQPGADLSRMTSDNVSVTEVIHKAMLDVNEQGSEAAGTTGIFVGRQKPGEGLKVEVVVDHPFLLAIVDTRNDLILFLGRVTNL